jgi:F-box protein 11
VLRGCSVHDSAQSGIFVYEQGRGTIEDNDTFGNASAGISVKEGGDPVVRGNRVNRNGYEGVWVYEGGGGTYEYNDLTGNQRGAWDVADDCLARVSRKNNKES